MRFRLVTVALLLLAAGCGGSTSHPVPHRSAAADGPAYAVGCTTPGVIAFAGTASTVDAWVATPPQLGGCWTVYYQDPTSLSPPTTLTPLQQEWAAWCAAHPGYYNPAVCPTHPAPPPTTTTTTLTPLQQEWAAWCALHPTYYNAAVCPTHIRPPSTTIPVGAVGP
ncbi:MAG: hypothetical protein KGH75_00180 [Rhodospirillales bacterium]|nr:hypothetical protein [Rhodospirillales bacterium]